MELPENRCDVTHRGCPADDTRNSVLDQLELMGGLVLLPYIMYYPFKVNTDCGVFKSLVHCTPCTEMAIRLWFRVFMQSGYLMLTSLDLCLSGQETGKGRGWKHGTAAARPEVMAALCL